MRFSDPWLFLLLLPLGAITWASYRQIRGLSRARKARAIALRGLILFCLVFALTGPEIYRNNQGSCTLILLDRSDSIRSSDRKSQEDFVRAVFSKMPEGDVGGVITFGGNSVLEFTPGKIAPKRSFDAKLESTSTDLAAAIRLASASFPDGKAKRIVIVSDGVETKGDARGAALSAAADNVNIDFVEIGGQSDGREVLVANLELPDKGKESEPFDLKVSVRSKGVRSAKLRIDRNGVIVYDQPVTLQEGSNSILVPQKVANTGLVRYRATIESNEDSDPRNNTGSGFINVRSKPKVLIVQERTTDRTLTASLTRSGLSADLVTSATMPNRIEQLLSYDSILFNDVNAATVSNSLMTSYAVANRDSGVGLAMIGGEGSFLPGGWYGTPIAEALPVDLNIRQKKSLAGASVFIMADCSGSMGAVEDGQTKITLASRAAEETIKMLGPMDRVGVAGSSDGIEIVTPMQSAENKESAIDGARRLAVTGGGIYIRPSIVKAYEVLKAEQSKTRHFILLADGGDSTDWQTVDATALLMRAEKITISVVAIGSGKDVPDLKRLAALGGGRFYLAQKASQLPAIFTQDTAVMSRSAIEEHVFIPKITQWDEAISGVFSNGLPALYAYCLAETRPLSKTLLKSDKDDPILVTGRNGLGATAAFMSDAQPKWARQWVGWNGFDSFWAQMVRTIGRQATNNLYRVDVNQEGGKAKVVVTGTDPNGNPLSAPETPVRIASPDGKSVELNLTQVAPGRYESEFDANSVGSYIVSVIEKDSTGATRIQSGGISVSYPSEYRVLGTNRALLKELSEIGRGQELKGTAGLFRPVALKGQSMFELFPWLIGLLLVLLPIDIANRRLTVSFRELWRTRKRKKAPSEAPNSVSNLKSAKQRVQAHRSAQEQPSEVPARAFRVENTLSEGVSTPPEPATAKPEAETEAGSRMSSSLLENRRKRQSKD